MKPLYTPRRRPRARQPSPLTQAAAERRTLPGTLACISKTALEKFNEGLQTRPGACELVGVDELLEPGCRPARAARRCVVRGR